MARLGPASSLHTRANGDEAPDPVLERARGNGAGELLHDLCGRVGVLGASRRPVDMGCIALGIRQACGPEAHPDRNEGCR